MQVIKSESGVRRTTVELTDREIALIDRALLRDNGNNDENSVLFRDFRTLKEYLSIPSIYAPDA